MATLAPAARGERVAASTISARTERVFAECAADSAAPLHLAKWKVPAAFGARAMPEVVWDSVECVVIRSVLMKPEHAAAAASIIERMECWDGPVL